jgi:hypothetical protein
MAEPVPEIMDTTSYSYQYLLQYGAKSSEIMGWYSEVVATPPAIKQQSIARC